MYEDRDRIARDLHDLVVQRLFATEMMLESTRRRAASSEESGDATEAGHGGAEEEQAEAGVLLGRAVDELDSTIQEVRTAIFALQQPPAAAPSTFRGRVLRETGGAAALLGFPPSVQFTGAVDALVGEETGRELLAALRGRWPPRTAGPGSRPSRWRWTPRSGCRTGGAGCGWWSRTTGAARTTAGRRR